MSSTVRPGASVPMPPRCGAVRRLLAEEVRLLPCSPRAWTSTRSACAVDINQIPTGYSAADGQRLHDHLETATVLLASTAPICMGHGMAARGAGRPSSAVGISLPHVLYRLYRPAVLVHGAHDAMMEHGARSLLMGRGEANLQPHSSFLSKTSITSSYPTFLFRILFA